MHTYTMAVSYLATSYSYSKEVTSSYSFTIQNHITLTDGHFIEVGGQTNVSTNFTSLSANHTQTLSTRSHADTVSLSGTHDHVEGGITVQSSYSSSKLFTMIEVWTINRTLTSFMRTEFTSLDHGTEGTSTTSSTFSGATTAASTETYVQITTTNQTSVETFRTTRTTSTTYLSTSVAGTNTVIYFPTTSAYTTTKSSSTVTQDGRVFTTTFSSTSVRQAFLMKTIVVCEPAFYSVTLVSLGQTITQTRGNEVLLVPTTTAAGLNRWDVIGTTADSTEFGSWSIAPVTLLPFGITTSSSTLTGLVDPGGGPFSTASITLTYFIVTNSYTMQTLLPTAASDTFSFHATRFVSSTTTSTYTSYTEDVITYTGTTAISGTTTEGSFFTSYTYPTTTATSTITVTDTSVYGSTGISTYSYYTSNTSISSGSFYSTTGSVTVFVSTGSNTYTRTDTSALTTSSLFTSSEGSFSSSYYFTESFVSSSTTASGTFTTSNTGSFTTGTTTTTSAMSNDFLPFVTNSTTTSLTGFIELYTTTAQSRKTTTTTVSHGTTNATGAFFYSTTVINSTLLRNTITTTLQVPGSYHLESSTITVVTTIMSKYLFVSNSQVARNVLADNVLLDAFHETNIYTVPSRSSASSFSHFSQVVSPGIFTQNLERNGITAGSTAEGMAGNGIVVRADLNFNGVFAAEAGYPFNVHPCMAIGFRPATNDAHSAPIYFSPTFNVGTFSMSAWSKFTTTTTVGTDTVSTTSSSTVSTIQTLSTIPFSHISLHQGTSASLFVSSPFTESRTVARSYTSVWGSYKSHTTTSTRTTSTTTDATTMTTTSASLVTHGSPFVVTETTISLFSGNTIFITRSAPMVFITNDGGNRYFSYDERFGTPFSIITTQTESVLIAFGASISDSTHLRNERPADSNAPRAYGGFHPVTTQTGYAIMGLAPNTWYTTTDLLIVGAAWKMTISPRSGGATTTTTTSMTMYSISENHTMGVFEILLTNDLSNIHAIEPLTAFSVTIPPTTGLSVIVGIEGTPFFTTTSRFPFIPADSTNT